MEGDNIAVGAPLWHRPKRGRVYHLRHWKRDGRGKALAIRSEAACGEHPYNGWESFDWYQPAPPSALRMCKRCLAVGS